MGGDQDDLKKVGGFSGWCWRRKGSRGFHFFQKCFLKERGNFGNFRVYGVVVIGCAAGEGGLGVSNAAQQCGGNPEEWRMMGSIKGFINT